jgi:hypothetical protein
LLKRVFDIDLGHCPLCGGDFKMIAAIAGQHRAIDRLSGRPYSRRWEKWWFQVPILGLSLSQPSRPPRRTGARKEQD